MCPFPQLSDVLIKDVNDNIKNSPRLVKLVLKKHLLGLASSPYVTSTLSVSLSVSLSDKVLILPTIRFF